MLSISRPAFKNVTVSDVSEKIQMLDGLLIPLCMNITNVPQQLVNFSNRCAVILLNFIGFVSSSYNLNIVLI